MKKFVVSLTMMIALLGMFTQVQAQEKKTKSKADKVEKMTCWASIDCESCKTKVEKNIAFEKGVKELDVDLKKKLITISYRSDKTNPQKLEKAIQDLGYKTEIVTQEEKKETKTEKK